MLGLIPESLRNANRDKIRWLSDRGLDYTIPLYQYSPLKEGEIRLVEISVRPDPYDDRKFFYDLAIKHVSIEHKVKYAAISYVWGDPTPSARLYFEGLSCLIPIACSCESILQRVARNFCDTKLYVWIDAVCIDQKNEQERGQQIDLMGDIYQNAQDVLVDLGEEEDKSHRAFEYLSKRSAEVGGESGRALALPAIKQLLNRPWFSRTWVLQEIYMSKSATVWCGEDHVPWERFKKAIHYNLEQGSFSQIANLPFALLIQDRDWSFPEDLLHLLHLARECGVKDPKDKYFALLSMLKKARNSQRLLNVNYSNTATEIFTSISTQLIQQRGLDLLVYKDGWSSLPDFPSWVVDWSKPNSNSALSRRLLNKMMREGDDAGLGIIDTFYNCGGDFEFTPYSFRQYQPHQKPSLEVFGFPIGTITHVSTPFNTMKHRFSETQEHFSRWRRELRDREPLSSCRPGESNEDVLLRLFTRFCFASSSPNDFKREQAVMNNDTETPFNLHKFIPSSARSHEQIKIDTKLNIHNRRLAFTDTNLIGLVPLDVAAGDVVHVIMSCPMPAILRQTPADEGTEYHWLVGCGVIDGVMKGEALREIKRADPRFNRMPASGPWMAPPGVRSLTLV